MYKPNIIAQTQCFVMMGLFFFFFGGGRGVAKQCFDSKKRKTEKEKGQTRGIYHHLYRGIKQKSRRNEMGTNLEILVKRTHQANIMGYKI